MRKYVLIVLIFVAAVAAKGQDYNTGIGFRGGLSNGLTVKHFTEGNKALEGILSTRWDGFMVTGLFEIHAPAFEVEGLNLYYGVGGHIGFWNGNHVPWSDENHAYTVLGIDGILGIEYCIPGIPINVSLDWKPEFNFIGYIGFYPDGALSIRYIF